MGRTDYSPAMLRLLREMRERENSGFMLRDDYPDGWWWACAGEDEKATGVHLGTLQALERRGAVKRSNRRGVGVHDWTLTSAGKEASNYGTD